MKKIPTIFIRNEENRKYVLDEVNPICQWVFNGDGVATRKYDGTCCMIKNGVYFKRREVKPGKSVPPDFLLEQHDENTGKTVGWVPVCPEDKYHLEAFDGQPDGTYELIGPKIQGNPENWPNHYLMPHSEAWKYSIDDRSYEGIKMFLKNIDIEGLVFHHPDGRMAKIKKRDFKY